MGRLLAVAGSCVLLVSLLGGCSSNKSASAPADCTVVPGNTFTVTAKNISWQANGSPLSCISVKAGQDITYTVDNEDDGIQHNFAVFGNGMSRVGTPLKAGVNKQTLQVKVTKPGHYTFVCDLHQNMEGDYYVK